MNLSKAIEEKIFNFLAHLYGLQVKTDRTNGVPVAIDRLSNKDLHFIEKHFPGHEIVLVWIGTEFFSTYYEVVLENGSKIKFIGKNKRVKIIIRVLAENVKKMGKYINKH